MWKQRDNVKSSAEPSEDNQLKLQLPLAKQSFLVSFTSLFSCTDCTVFTALKVSFPVAESCYQRKALKNCKLPDQQQTDTETLIFLSGIDKDGK